MTGVVVAPPEDGYVSGLQSETLLFKGKYTIDPTKKKYLNDVTLKPDSSNPTLDSDYVITGIVGWDLDSNGVFIANLSQLDITGFTVDLRCVFETTKLTNKELKVWVRAIRIVK